MTTPSAAGGFHQIRRHPPVADLETLLSLKARHGVTITACLPARDEEATVPAICETIVADLMEPGLVEQLVVIDSRSGDSTAARAQRAGAEVYPVTEILPSVPGHDGGKGEALWKSLAVARGNIVVWMDADTRNFTSDFALRLVEPLLESPEVVLAKAFYERPLAQGDELNQGARVTELVARPLLNLFLPDLADVVQPLAGEYALRTAVARSIPFLSGYAADVGILIWVAERFGLESIAQVDLGRRVHRNQDIRSLGRMAHQVMQGMFHAFDASGRLKLVDPPSTRLVQFHSENGASEREDFDLPIFELPPMATMLH